MKWIAASVMLVVASSAAAAQETCPAGAIWPGDEWPSRVDAIRASKKSEIAALEKLAFTLVGDDAARKGPRTDAVLIIQHGAVVYERYARGFDASKRHLTWSVSKSLTSALAGVAVHEGLLNVDDSICKTMKDLPASSCAVTVDSLLEMASGLDWKETYENESNQQSSVLALLYGQGQSDMGRFNASHIVKDIPGSAWRYSSGDTCTLADVVGHALMPKYGPRFPWPALFDRIGAKHVVFEQDPAGTFIGASYWYATARDAARLGVLYQNDGCWNGARLLPEGWVKSATTPNDAWVHSRPTDETGVYGRLFWLNQPVLSTPAKKPYPDAPDDLFAAEGHWGQSVAVIPSLDVVIVRFADDREHGAFDWNQFFKLAIAVAAPSAGAP